MSGRVQVLERAAGRSGELVLRRSGADLEVILNGAFLISTANEASSRAMIAAALPHLAGDALEVLIGGLGLGYALDEALASARVAHVTVAEYEPLDRALVPRRTGRGARRAPPQASAPGAPASRWRTSPTCWPPVPAAIDLVSLDTDNGPEWLVRDGQRRPVHRGRRAPRARRAAARRRGRVLVARPLSRVRASASSASFARVLPVPAHDIVPAVVSSTPCTWRCAE